MNILSPTESNADLPRRGHRFDPEECSDDFLQNAGVTSMAPKQKIRPKFAWPWQNYPPALCERAEPKPLAGLRDGGLPRGPVSNAEKA